MSNEQSLFEIIRSRRSCRHFERQEISTELLTKITDRLEQIENPFQHEIKLRLLDSQSVRELQDIKLGTYGIIKGARYYLASACLNTPEHMIAVGYLLEKVVLFVTQQQLGHCWLGGSLRRQAFQQAMQLSSQEIGPIVIPIGFSAEKSTMIDKMLRFVAKSDKRKLSEELFFENQFETSFSSEDESQESTVFEMVRLAPSASNQQPWRILKIGNDFHFFIERTPGYGGALGFDIQMIDIGIAMAHFEMAMSEFQRQGHWTKMAPTLNKSQDQREYIFTWSEQKS